MLTEVSKKEFFNSKWVTTPENDCNISIDDSDGYPYTVLLKR